MVGKKIEEEKCHNYSGEKIHNLKTNTATPSFSEILRVRFHEFP